MIAHALEILYLFIVYYYLTSIACLLLNEGKATTEHVKAVISRVKRDWCSSLCDRYVLRRFVFTGIEEQYIATATDNYTHYISDLVYQTKQALRYNRRAFACVLLEIIFVFIFFLKKEKCNNIEENAECNDMENILSIGFAKSLICDRKEIKKQKC